MRVVLVHALLSKGIKLKAALSLPQISPGPESSKNTALFLWIDILRQETHRESGSTLWQDYYRLSSNRHPSLFLTPFPQHFWHYWLNYLKSTFPWNRISYICFFLICFKTWAWVPHCLHACVLYLCAFGLGLSAASTPPPFLGKATFSHADALQSFSSFFISQLKINVNQCLSDVVDSVLFWFFPTDCACVHLCMHIPLSIHHIDPIYTLFKGHWISN